MIKRSGADKVDGLVGRSFDDLRFDCECWESLSTMQRGSVLNIFSNEGPRAMLAFETRGDT